MHYSVYALLGVCCTWCMLYWVNAVLGVNSWSCHGEIERYDLASSSEVMVELRTRKRDIRGDGGNHYEKLELKRILCASQFTIPNTAGTSSNPACNYTDMRSFQLNQASRTPDFSYLLVFSILFSSSSSSLSLSSTTLPSSQNTKFSHPPLSLNAIIMSWHRVQHSLSTANTEYSIHRVQHTSSTAYTEYSIHRVQHTPSTAYTE